MKKGNVQEILSRLRQELQGTEDVDLDARRQLEDLHREVDEMHDTEDTDVESLWDRAKELETRFAADHPTLERIARDLADAIGKMGV